VLPPRFALLAYSTGARDEGHSAKALRQAQPQRAATLRLTLGDNPADPFQSQGQTFLNRERGFHTLPAIAIPDAQAQRNASIAAHSKTEQHLRESVTAIFALARGRAGGLWRLRFILLGPREGNGRGVLMEPGGGDARDLQGFEGNGTQALVEMGRKEGIPHVPSPVIMQRGPREPRLQQRHHPTLFQPLPDCIQGMSASQNREHQGFHSPPSREPRRRVGREKAVEHCGDVQAPQDAQNERSMGHGIHLLDSTSHDAPPVVAAPAS
jgi:hypothetical protein